MAITLGGASGGSEINDNKVINSLATLITTESGEKWLRSGTLDANTSAYPNATSLLSSEIGRAHV